MRQIEELFRHAMGMKIGPSLTRPKTVIDEGALNPFWMRKTE